MKYAIPFISYMGHPSDHPIFNQKVVWCQCELIIEGCGDSYKKRFRHKDSMTMKEVYHHCTSYYWKQDCSLHKVISICIGYVNECCNFYYKLHETSLVCASSYNARESITYKWLRY